MRGGPAMLNSQSITDLLAGRHIAVVGASDDKGNFGGTVYRALRDHDYDVVAVNPNARTVAGDRCYPDLASVPAPVDGAILMVSRTRALDVIDACADQH